MVVVVVVVGAQPETLPVLQRNIFKNFENRLLPESGALQLPDKPAVVGQSNADITEEEKNNPAVVSYLQDMIPYMAYKITGKGMPSFCTAAAVAALSM